MLNIFGSYNGDSAAASSADKLFNGQTKLLNAFATLIPTILSHQISHC